CRCWKLVVFSTSRRGQTILVSDWSSEVCSSDLGKRLLIDDTNQGPRPIEIVGVVDNVRHVALDLPPSFDIYLPLRQVHPDGLARSEERRVGKERRARGGAYD